MSATISADGKSITCSECGRTSYSAGDVLNGYCGHCAKFHAEIIIAKTPPPLRESGREMVSVLALISFFGWTALVGIVVAAYLFQGAETGVIADQHNAAANTGMVLGLGLVMTFLFIAWLCGAVPTFLVWFICKKK